MVFFCNNLAWAKSSEETIRESAYEQEEQKSEVKYRTAFGNCPSRPAGVLTLRLIKDFEKHHSLKELKELILKEKLKERHYLSSYNIKYDPFKSMLKFEYECPWPLMRTQVYKRGGMDSYEAILVDNGDLFDPTFEVVLRDESKLEGALPSLALPVESLNSELRQRIAKLMLKSPINLRTKISEVIIDNNNDMTVILSLNGRTSNAFLGKESWEDKFQKLQRLVNYFDSSKKAPATIYMHNSKKVVVKFGDKS